MDRVELAPGSRWHYQRARNRDYLLSMNATDLMCEYTSAANLTGTFQNPTCVKMDRNGYWGHYLGHWLSATAQLYNATVDEDVKAAGVAVVARLAEVQAAWVAAGPEYAGGFLFPYSIVSFQNLFGPPSRNCAPVCVPFYIYHKVLAGMLDHYVLAHNEQALAVALGMAAWAKQAIEKVLSEGGQDLWQSVLDTEWGGMNDALFNLHSVTGDERWIAVANYFNHWSWSAPLAAHVDDLAGNHANTHIPEVVGDARGFELTGNLTKRDIAVNFFDIITSGHSFATGGSNSGEHWGVAHRLGDGLDADTEESCTTYNILKVARHAFSWTAESRYFDFYERALLNGLIGNQATTGEFSEATGTTGFIYMLPLGGGGLQKPWGASNENLPCCWGTLSETFAKLSDSVYWQSADGSALFVNLFAPSVATWGEDGSIRLTQRTNYPYATKWTTRLSLEMKAPRAFKLALRVPFWATSGKNEVWVNGAAVSQTVEPGTYFVIERTWTNGDSVDALFPMSLRFEQLDDSRPDWQGVGAILYGGIMLAAVNTTTDRLPIPDLADLATAITRFPAVPEGDDYTDMTFVAKTACGESRLVPLMDVAFEQYAAYFHTKDETSQVVPFNASGSELRGDDTGFGTVGGASLVPNGPDVNIRSGNPGEVNRASWVVRAQDKEHKITGFSFSYQYVAGYGPDGAPGAANFSVVAVETQGCGDGRVLATLYESPELAHYAFDECNTCYSPAVDVEVRDLDLSAKEPVELQLVFRNNARNVQLRLPMAAKVYWSSGMADSRILA